MSAYWVVMQFECVQEGESATCFRLDELLFAFVLVRNI